MNCYQLRKNLQPSQLYNDLVAHFNGDHGLAFLYYIKSKTKDFTNAVSARPELFIKNPNGEVDAVSVLSEYELSKGAFPRYSRLKRGEMEYTIRQMREKFAELEKQRSDRGIPAQGLTSALSEFGKKTPTSRHLYYDEEGYRSAKLLEIARSGKSAAEQDRLRQELESQIEQGQQLGQLGTLAHGIMAALIKLEDLQAYEDPSYQTRTALRTILDSSYAGEPEMLEMLNEGALRENFTDAAIQNLFAYAVNLKKQLMKDRARQNALFTTEEALVWVSRDGSSAIKGRGDLLLLKEDGTFEVLDFKFSRKGFAEWPGQKYRNTEHQLVGYSHMLRNAGFRVSAVTALPAALTLVQDRDGRWVIAGVEGGGVNDMSPQMRPGTQEKTFEVVSQIIPLDEAGPFFKQPPAAAADIKGFLNKHLGYQIEQVGQNNRPTVKELRFFLNGDGAKPPFVKINREKGTVQFTDHRPKVHKVTVPDIDDPDYYSQVASNRKFMQAVSDYIVYRKSQKYNAGHNLQKLINEMFEKLAEGKEFTPNRNFDINMVAQLGHLLERYTDEYRVVDGRRVPVWKVVVTPEMQELGMAMVVNNESRKVHVLNFTQQSNTTVMPQAFGHRSILGNYVTENEQPYQASIPSDVGHIELLKAAMFLAANHQSFSGYEIEHIISYNVNGKGNIYAHLPYRRLKQELDKLIDISRDESPFAQMLRSFDGGFGGKGAVGALVDYLSMLKAKGDPSYARDSFLAGIKRSSETTSEVVRLIKDRILVLNSRSRVERGNVKLNLASSEDHRELIFLTKALLSIEHNVDLNDLTGDISRWGKFLLDENAKVSNPDEIRQPAMRMVVKITQEAIEKIRRTMVSTVQNEYRPQFKKIISANIKDIKGKVWGDARLAYTNLFEHRRALDGRWERTWRLRDPGSVHEHAPHQGPLSEAEKEAIMFLKKHFNDIRRSKGLVVDGDNEWDIPLMRASAFTKAMQKGLRSAWKETMNDFLNPGNAFDQDRSYDEQLHTLSRVPDAFDYQEDASNREVLINETDEVFEDNLEAVLYAYKFNHLKASEFNRHMPVINGIASAMLAGEHAFFRDYGNVGNAIVEYIQSAIMHNPLLTEDEKQFMNFARPLSKLVEVMAIGLSPTLLPVQMLTGLWGNLVAMSGIAADRFRKRDFMKAGLFVYGKATADSLGNVNFLNYMTEEFGLFESDMVRLRAGMMEDRTGIKAFSDRWLHWVSSYPDWVNRMHLFVAEALADGVVAFKNGPFLDNENSALVFDKEKKKLVYRPEKDGRFNLVFDPSANRAGDEYKKQKALYDVMLKEVEREDGKKYDRLPRPYTSRQVLDKKKLANRIFGDYDYHNRINASHTAIGTLALQFKTWWLAVKNMYYKEYDDDGTAGKYVMEKGPDGEWRPVWKGRPMEGIWQSFKYSWTALRENSWDPLATWDQLRGFQKQNIRQAATSLMTFGLITLLAGAIMEGDDEGVEKTTKEYIAKILKSSSKDLFLINNLKMFLGGDTPFMSVSFVNRAVFKTLGLAFGFEFEAAGRNLVRSIGLTRPFYDLYQATSGE